MEGEEEEEEEKEEEGEEEEARGVWGVGGAQKFTLQAAAKTLHANVVWGQTQKRFKRTLIY